MDSELNQSFYDPNNLSVSLGNVINKEKSLRAKFKKLIIKKIMTDRTCFNFYVKKFFCPKFLGLADYSDLNEIKNNFSACENLGKNLNIENSYFFHIR